MMAASATLTGGVLNVLGSDGDDTIKFLQSGKNIYVQGVTGYWSASAVKSIYVDSKGGNDYISFNSYYNGGNKPLKEFATIIGGSGNERVSVGAAHDLVFSGQGNYATVDAKGVASLKGVAQNLASYASAVLKSGVLTVTGTNGNDNLKFAQVNGNIYITGVAGSFKASKVSSIIIRLQDGTDNVSLQSLANGGTQALAENVYVYSGPGSNTVRLANGQDVSMNGAGNFLAVDVYGNAKLNGQAVVPPAPNPTPTPTPTPNPTPTPTPNPPAGNWFDTNITDAALRSLGSSLYADNAISRADMISLLQNAGDNGAVDSTELADLQKIVNNSTLFAGLHYVERLAEYVVLGTVANTSYAGAGLGNLVAGSTTAHMTNLVNKWFLGLDRPNASGTYRQFAGQLFVNGAAYTDVNQGQVGNCYFMASLAEAALRNPSVLNNLFVVNGDGTYTVKFFNYGQAEYVTVDTFLPTNGSGNAIYAGMGKNFANSANELWTMLAEKAYVQANQFGWIRPGLPGSGQNAYSGIEGGYIYASLGHVTGQTTIAFASTASSANFTTFVTAWNAGKLIGFASKSTPASGSGVVGNHAYTVIGYNSTNQTITLYNPWGPNYATVTMTWAQIGGSFSYFDRTA
jgi:hypothetical protein